MPDLPLPALLASTATVGDDAHDITPEMLGDHAPPTTLDRVRDQLAVLLDTEDDVTVATALHAFHTMCADALADIAADPARPDHYRARARDAITRHAERMAAWSAVCADFAALRMRRATPGVVS